MHLSNNLVLNRVSVVLILVTFSTTVNATDYYISSSGNDINNGLSALAPWKTIAKVNTVFPTLKPGDRILFRKGDSFYGTLKITKSGSAGNPITIGAYGNGGKPVFTGYTTISGWTDSGNGIYSTPVKCESSPQIVTIDGVQFAKGRWPNSESWPGVQTWASIDSYNGTTSITDADLTTTGFNWTGAELVVMTSTRNKISVLPVTNQTGNTLYYTGGSSASPLGEGWGYFIQNDRRTLDSFGEWYYDTENDIFYMYFGLKKPSAHFVNIATLDNLIRLSPGVTYCQFDYLNLFGVNKTAINGSWNHNTIIKNCDISSCGYYGISLTKSTFPTISNCIIDHCNDDGLYIVEDCDNAIISNNTVRYIGLFPGMGQGLFESCMGIFIRGSNNAIVEYNKVENIGYNGIRYSGNNMIIRNNFVNNYCIFKEDGGGICYAGQSTYSNMKVINNIVINGLGSAGSRPSGTYPWVTGIYVDYNATGGMEIVNNTVANVKLMGGILVNCSQNVIISNNTIFECTSGVRIQEIAGLGITPRNITLTGNIIFAKTPSYRSLSLYSLNNDFEQFGSFDKNYYAIPLDNSKPILTGISGNVTTKSLNEWQTLYKQDLNSNISPITLKDTADIDFYYNASKSAKTFALVQPMVDVKGQKYYNSVTLEPYTSIILMTDPSPEKPVVPVFLSSAIQNSSQDKIEISCNVALSATPPPASSFAVKVNGVTRNVTNIVISDTKIILTLETPVKFGDIVTFSYTQPETNKLQSSKGSPAESITEQVVKNNIIDQAISNKPPVIVLRYGTTAFSGFVYEIDASGTTDPDQDNITYSWKVPYSVPVSGTTGSIIKFLAPVVKRSEILTFVLSATDGRDTIEKSIDINLLPYKPETGILKVSEASASDSYKSYYPGNVTDGNPVTRWSVEGDDQWLLLNLSTCKISHLQVAFMTEKRYEMAFDIYASKDTNNWEPVIIRATSCSFSGAWQIFDFPEITRNSDYAYIKLVVHGNASDDWNDISEIKVFGTNGDPDSKSSYNSSEISLYPNPVSEYINVLISEPSSDSQSFRIYNSSGKLCLEEILDTGVNYFRFTVSLKPGIYIVKILQSGLITHTQKLIVVQS